MFKSTSRNVSIALVAYLLAMAAGPASAQGQASGTSAGSGSGEKIIVSGASGNLGGLTVEALLARGVPASRLILVSRTPGQLAEYAAMGASTRFGDFTKPDSLPAAYAGGKRMLLISIGGGNLPEPRPLLQKRAIDAAIAAGVEQIAYTSWAAISRGDTEGISVDHVATEKTLTDSGVAWTMLRNSVYMDGIVQQAADMIRSGRAVAAPNEIRMGYITRADCAEAAAAVLTTPGHENKVYDLTGPELVGTREIAAAAAAVSGKPIEVVEGGNARGLAMPALSFVSTDFEKLTGHPATSVRELLEQNVDAL